MAIDRVCSLIKMQVPLRNRGLLFTSGTVVPTGDGYQTGCIFQKTDGGGGTSLYVNEGSVTSASFVAIEGGIYDVAGLVVSASVATGILVSGSTTQGIHITGAATSAQLKISGTAILASGEQAIYINCAAETVATNGIWITLKSNVTSGDLSGVRSRVYATGASGTCNPRGVYAEAHVAASGFANVADGVLAVVNVAAGTTDTQHVACMRAHFSTGAGFTNDVTFYVIHGRCQTRSDETFSGNNALLGLENEAVGGTGTKLNAAIEVKYTNLSGGIHAVDYLIDGGVAVNLIDTAVLRLPDDGAVCEASGAGTGDAGGADFVGYIKVVIGTTDMYIPLLTNTPANIFT